MRLVINELQRNWNRESGGSKAGSALSVRRHWVDPHQASFPVRDRNEKDLGSYAEFLVHPISEVVSMPQYSLVIPFIE